MAADLPPRHFAPDRAAHNRRVCRWLLALLAASLVPLMSAVTVWTFGWTRLFHLRDPGAFEMATLARSVVDMATLALALACGAIAVALGGVYVLTGPLRLRGIPLRPWDPRADPRVDRALEQLAIGVGIAPPALRLLDVPAANALVSGTPGDEPLVAFSAQLASRLDARELDGVLAHALARIVNEDTRLDAVLAALLLVMGWPAAAWHAAARVLRSPTELVRWAGWAAVLVLAVVLLAVGPMALTMAVLAGQGALMTLAGPTLQELARGGEPPAWLVTAAMAWYLHALLAPLWIFVIAPLLVLRIRRSVAWRRAFLADADAVTLTRDPDGLARALVRMGEPRQALALPGRASPMLLASARPAASLLELWLSVHPPVAARVAALQRMGTGLPPELPHAPLEVRA